jgi:hypothetical protein
LTIRAAELARTLGVATRSYNSSPATTKDTIDGGEGDESPSGCEGGAVGAGDDALYGGRRADLIGGGDDGGGDIAGDGG